MVMKQTGEMQIQVARKSGRIESMKEGILPAALAV
jgi:hypothetical protein